MCRAVNLSLMGGSDFRWIGIVCGNDDCSYDVGSGGEGR